SYNSPAGRVLANMLVYRSGLTPADGFRVLLSADVTEFAKKRLAMFVLRSKVMITDVTGTLARFGIGGPRGRDAVRAAFGIVPEAFGLHRQGGVIVLGVPGPRYIVTAPIADAEATLDALAREARPADFDVWRWLTIHSGVAFVTE